MPAAPVNDLLAAPLLFDERGLMPCIAQDAVSGEVLMFAYMNREALSLTRNSGKLHLWSRSRQQIWRKGESSGNTMTVRSLRLDCDGDCILALVEPAGPACHTGERTCFHRALSAKRGRSASAEGDLSASAEGDLSASAEGDLSADAERDLSADAERDLSAESGADALSPIERQPCEMLPALERTLEARASERPAGSYTVQLLDDPPLIGEKVMEEAEEVARAARQESDRRVAEEAADVLYHLLVLLHSRGRQLRDAIEVLIERAKGGQR